MNLIDKIIKEPLGGAHNDPETMYKTMKAELKKMMKELIDIPKEELILKRVDKFSKMGVYTEE